MIYNEYFDIFLENPLKTYKKIKKYFKPLKPKLSFGCYKKKYGAKILKLNSFDVNWKDKWNSPRHEINPGIIISLFNYIHISIWFNSENPIHDTAYWESALYWLYYKVDLYTAVEIGSEWSDYNENTKEFEKIKFNVLREPWQTMYNNKELKNWYYDGTK